MQTNSINNLIATLFYANNNNLTYYVKHKNKTKVIKHKYNLTNTYNTLYKNYNCTLQQLNFIQFAYVNNSIKHNLSFKYNCLNNYKQLNKCLNTM